MLLLVPMVGALGCGRACPALGGLRLFKLARAIAGSCCQWRDCQCLCHCATVTAGGSWRRCARACAPPSPGSAGPGSGIRPPSRGPGARVAFLSSSSAAAESVCRPAGASTVSCGAGCQCASTCAGGASGASGGGQQSPQRGGPGGHRRALAVGSWRRRRPVGRRRLLRCQRGCVTAQCHSGAQCWLWASGCRGGCSVGGMTSLSASAFGVGAGASDSHHGGAQAWHVAVTFGVTFL